MTLAPAWVGHRVSRFQEVTGVRVAFLTRLGEATLPTAGMVFQDGDLVHVLMYRDRVAEVEAACVRGPEPR